MHSMHLENSYPWDEPVAKEHWNEIADYCANDVIATEAVFNYKHADFEAREMLAAIAGGTVNDSTNKLTTLFISEGDPDKLHSSLVYTDLSQEFPGYRFVDGESWYKGYEVGEGGFVYALEGVHFNVKVFDVASMHPSSIHKLGCFGDYYTERFWQIVMARLYIKHGDYEAAGQLFNGALKPYLTDPKSAKALADALKTAINSVYGMTFASFPNAFRDDRNIDNIVAKRGALFMIDLMEAVQKEGYKVVHIKTDSIKVVNADDYIEKFIVDYGKEYGYNFEVENVYERMCLVNDAVYIARHDDGKWEATGKQFQIPYVFKTLFSKEDVIFYDLAETFNVSTALYLDCNEDKPDVTEFEKALKNVVKKLKDDPDNAGLLKLKEEYETKISYGHNYKFVGSVGSFMPVREGLGGGKLMAKRDNSLSGYGYATGAKGYRWIETEFIKSVNKDVSLHDLVENVVDMKYWDEKVFDATDIISHYCGKIGISFDDFVGNNGYEPVPNFMNVPETEEVELPFD